MTMTKSRQNFELKVCTHSLNTDEKKFLYYWKIIKEQTVENEKIEFFKNHPEAFNLKSGTPYSNDELDEDWDWEVHLYNKIKIKDWDNGSDELLFGHNLNGIIKEYIYLKTPEGWHESDFDIQMTEEDVEEFYIKTKENIFPNEFIVFAFNRIKEFISGYVFHSYDQIESHISTLLKESSKTYNEDELYDLIEEKLKLWETPYTEAQIEVGAKNIFNQLYQHDNHQHDYYSTKPSFYESGKSKLDAKDYQGAIDDFNRAILVSPNNQDIKWKRGIAHSRLGDHESANKDFKQVRRRKG